MSIEWEHASLGNNYFLFLSSLLPFLWHFTKQAFCLPKRHRTHWFLPLPSKVQSEWRKSQNVVKAPVEPSLINCALLQDPQRGERKVLVNWCNGFYGNGKQLLSETFCMKTIGPIFFLNYPMFAASFQTENLAIFISNNDMGSCYSY